MATTIECPIDIGGTYWVAASTPHQVSVPCPVCAGQRWFTVILGSGETLQVECDGCGHGYDGPRGFIQQYQHEPAVKQVVVDRVASMPGSGREEWSFYTLGKGYYDQRELFTTEADAMAHATVKAAAQHELNMESYQRKKKKTQRAGWSVRYHREQIADMQRRIAWHESKIQSVGPSEASAGGGRWRRRRIRWRWR